MEEREFSADEDPLAEDPFADVAPPDWGDLPSHEEVLSMPTGRPAHPTVSSESVGPPPLPPPVGGPEETEWSVQGSSRPELASLVGDPTAPSAPPEEVERPIPIESGPAAVAPVLDDGTGEAAEEPLVLPPGFWGDQPDDGAEPEDEPIIDLSTRDTAGLLSHIGGAVLWLGGVAAAWYFLTRQPDPILAERNWPTPESTWDALVELAESADARTTVRETTQRFLAALVIGSVVGILIGSTTGPRRIARNLLRPGVGVFRVVSPILLVPLVLVWGGAGWWVGWAPAAVAVAALTAWTTDRALSKPPPRLTTLSGPDVVRGVRSATLVAWTLVFATEAMLGLDGIFAEMGRTAGVMNVTVAWLVVAALLALITEGLLQIVERAVARG